ncbi:DNA-binding NarL/FixJ family response regulator [Granulicella aggregans]|uniref:DNA-binding NarL/FixJ family response regulator n=1 Tax=Granulicella aggregans TaxID=474949 RepID=A0A7W7ZHX7_9BACT|nr:DNA-binding NarL/FixJ family response regulator [Granulicella aggregans]
MNDQKEVRVFVVDDETVIATTLTAILKQSGFDAVGFTNPLKALAAADEKSPDLLISDVVCLNFPASILQFSSKRKLPPARFFSFPGKHQLPTCLPPPAKEDLISHSSPSPSTPLTS